MAPLQVRRLGYALGAEVRGVDLRARLDAEIVGAIRGVWLEHQLLCFPEQDISKDDFVAFANCFGEVDGGNAFSRRDPDNPSVILLSNQPVNGKPWDGYKDGQSWHSDRSFRVDPTIGTFVTARQIPEVGGDTMFANQYLAFETLSPAMQTIVEGLGAVHDHAMIKGAEVQSPEKLATLRRNQPPVVHPAVKIHPETGRKALYLGDRVRQFVGMTEEESRPLLDFFVSHAVRYEFTYRHRWRVHDLIMWDNRCLMHLAPSAYDLRRDVRHLWRVSHKGPAIGTLYAPGESGAAVAASAT